MQSPFLDGWINFRNGSDSLLTEIIARHHVSAVEINRRKGANLLQTGPASAIWAHRLCRVRFPRPVGTGSAHSELPRLKKR
jgi:hypothetical protein